MEINTKAWPNSINTRASTILKPYEVVRFRFLEGFLRNLLTLIICCLFQKKYRATVVYKIALSGSVFDFQIRNRSGSWEKGVLYFFLSLNFFCLKKTRP